MKTMLFNPYTGTPRHPSDIASDPEGILILDPDAPLRAAQPTCNQSLQVAQPPSEPVAWIVTTREFHEYEGSAKVDTVGYLYTSCSGYAKQPSEGRIPLFTHPAHTEQEVQELLSSSDDNRYPDLCEDTIRRILGVPLL